jgi:YY1-associated factor 2
LSHSTPRLKNVDRSSATYHSVTVNDLTVVITEFKPKVKKEKKAKTSKTASTLDEDSSRTSRSPSASNDGLHSDENSHPNGLANTADSNSSF